MILPAGRDLIETNVSAVTPELHSLSWFVFQSEVFRWNGGVGRLLWSTNAAVESGG